MLGVGQSFYLGTVTGHSGHTRASIFREKPCPDIHAAWPPGARNFGFPVAVSEQKIACLQGDGIVEMDGEISDLIAIDIAVDIGVGCLLVEAQFAI